MTVIKENRTKKSVSFDADQYKAIELLSGVERRDFGPQVEVLCREALYYRKLLKSAGKVELSDALTAVLNLD